MVILGFAVTALVALPVLYIIVYVVDETGTSIMTNRRNKQWQEQKEAREMERDRIARCSVCGMDARTGICGHQVKALRSK